jgi:hypothetical protein
VFSPLRAYPESQVSPEEQVPSMWFEVLVFTTKEDLHFQHAEAPQDVQSLVVQVGLQVKVSAVLNGARQSAE